MKDNAGILKFFKKKFICLNFAFIALMPFSLAAQTFSNPAGSSPFQQENPGVSVGATQAGVDQSGLIYSPFSPFSPTQLQNGNEPVLYGPGGNPIGGLPIENGSIILLGMVLGYALFRMIRTRMRYKKTQILPIVLLCCSFLSLQAQEKSDEAKLDSLKQYYMQKEGLSEYLANIRAKSVLSAENSKRKTSVSTLRGDGTGNGSIKVGKEYDTYTPEQLVRNIFINGGGSSCGTEGNVSNVKYTGQNWDQATQQWLSVQRPLAYFSNGDSLGMSTGLLLGTGIVNAADSMDEELNAEGPNRSPGGMGGGASVPLDPDLKYIFSNITTVSQLEFDFVPLTSEISFDYIFASDEYPEFANSDYNDIFGFFISGPGISGPYANGARNIALLPDGETPITINNINDGKYMTNRPNQQVLVAAKNPEYYVPNYNAVSGDLAFATAGQYMEYDGRTVMLQAKATVIPGQTYHLKLSIANVQDTGLGSGVFLRAGSFDLGLGITNYGNNIKDMDRVFEGCTNNKFSIGVNPSANSIPVTLTYSGDGVNYIKSQDGSGLPASVNIPANTSSYDVSYKVLDPLPSNGLEVTVTATVGECADPMATTIHLYKKLQANPVVVGVCPSGNTGAITYNITGGSPYAELSIDNGTTWTLVSNHSGYRNALPAGTYSLKVREPDNSSCQSVLSYSPVIGTLPTLMYWSKTASDNNWNNPSNWTNASNVVLNAVPQSCVTVHIPGNSNNYPSLDTDNTPRNILGNPTCGDIYFHFGGEVAKPQELTYTKAFIQYNFGYYNGGWSWLTDFDSFSAAPMERNRWYALSAPLKKIATGDFAMGGYPHTWQREFKSSRNADLGALTGGWYDPQNPMGLLLEANQQYAISLYVPSRNVGVLGEDNQMHLENLKGIFEIPYFENATISAQHRLHQWQGGSKTSRFFYYSSNNPSLPIASDIYSDVFRGNNNEAYRFIFDGNLTPQKSFTINVPVVDKDGDFQIDEVMIGNPYLSSLDFTKLYSNPSNVGKLEDSYRLFSNGTYATYSAGSNPPFIASFQAFFIQPKGTIGTDVTLTFTEDMSVVRPGAHQLKSDGASSDGFVKVTVLNPVGDSWMMLSFNPAVDRNIPRLFYYDKAEPFVPQVYTLDGQGNKNAVQYIAEGSFEIPMGIVGNHEGEYQLSFEGLDNLNVNSLKLIDRVKGNETTDLFQSPVYTFHSDSLSNVNRFTLLVNKEVSSIDGIAPDAVLSTKVYATGKVLYVESLDMIQNIAISNVQGVNVDSYAAAGHQAFTKELSLPAGVYLVSVQLNNGETKTAKIVVQ